MIDILLATYNGERYLPALLDSVFGQTCQDFRVTALDDGSRDGTPGVLSAWAARRPGQMRVLPAAGHSGDPSGVFFRLLQESTGEYSMFCDQDDIWLPEKIRLTLRKVQGRETEDPARPLLAHTDLRVVGEDLKPISPSLMRYQHLDPRYRSLPRLVVQNNVTGCTILLNRALRERVRVPEQPVMHDWWIALTGAAFGEIAYVSEPTVLYRQHGSNAVGAHNASAPAFLLSRLRGGSIRESLARTYALARCFLDTYRDILSPDQRTFLEQYAGAGDTGAWQRLRLLSHYMAYKKGAGRRLAQVFMGRTGRES